MEVGRCKHKKQTGSDGRRERMRQEAQGKKGRMTGGESCDGDGVKIGRKGEKEKNPEDV